MIDTFIKDNIYVISIVTVQTTGIITLILILIRVIHHLWFRYSGRIRRELDATVGRYLEQGDTGFLSPYRRCIFFKHWIIKRYLVYRSFGREDPVIERLAAAYRYLGYSARDMKTTRSPVWFRRAEAARCLGQLRITESKEDVKLLLADRNMQVRLIAAWSLVRHRDRDFIVPVMESLIGASRLAGLRLSSAVFEIGESATDSLIRVVRHSNANIRILAVHLLGELAAKKAVPELMASAAEDRDGETAVAVCKALGNIKDPGGEGFLVRGLSSPNWVMRAQAVLAIGKMAREGMTQKIAPLLGDDKWWVRYNTGKALYMMGDPGRRELLAASGAQGKAGDMARQWLSEYDV